MLETNVVQITIQNMYWSKVVRTRFIRYEKHWITGDISDEK